MRGESGLASSGSQNAAQSHPRPKKPVVATPSPLNSLNELMPGVIASLRMASGAVFMLRHWHSGADGFFEDQVEHRNRRRLLTATTRAARQSGSAHGVCELIRRMNDTAANNCQHRFDGFDVFISHGKIVVREHGQVSELAGGDCAFLAALRAEPTAALRVEP